MKKFSAAERWFESRGWASFAFQRQVWRSYLAGESGLIHAATGTGKTLAAWWGPLLQYVNSAAPEESTARRRRSNAVPLKVLWVTPLRALAGDTAGALNAPVKDLGIPWTVETRTGDTTSSLKARQSKRLPTALVTTPESLSLLLSRNNAAEQFAIWKWWWWMNGMS